MPIIFKALPGCFLRKKSTQPFWTYCTYNFKWKYDTFALPFLSYIIICHSFDLWVTLVQWDATEFTFNLFFWYMPAHLCARVTILLTNNISLKKYCEQLWVFLKNLFIYFSGTKTCNYEIFMTYFMQYSIAVETASSVTRRD